jgi:hypothetical protein
MKQTIRSFVGMDVHKATISISVAEDGRSGPVRFIGVIPNTPEAVGKMAKQLTKHGELDFCYEASGCGYGIHRQLTGLGHKCTVAAPSMIPRKPGERIKADRRDSEKLAILHRSGDLTPVWVQTPPTKRSATWSGRESMLPCTSCGLASSCSHSSCVMVAAMRPASTGLSAIAAGWQVRPFKNILTASSSRIIWKRCGLHRREETP